MTLEIRPSITPEDKVDMLISVELSQLSDNIVNSQPVRGSMTTETKMIVENGQTLMLAGILFQKDSLVQRKVPLLGDVPLLGGLFRHKVKNLTNNELIVFIIPEVIDDGETMSSTAETLMKEPMERLNDVRGAIKDSFQKEDIDFGNPDPNAM
jgi:type II secretory pathway component GspD/PulD (secretin)